MKTETLKTAIDAKPTEPVKGGSFFDQAKAAATLALAKTSKKNLPAASKGPQQQASWNIQKPARNKFHRVHPDESYRMLGVPTLTDPEDDGAYFILLNGVEDLLDESVVSQVKHIDLHAAQDHTGAQYLWPVKHSNSSWFKAAKNVVNSARRNWLTVWAVMSAQTYKTSPPVNPIPDPDWSLFPPFEEMLESAFSNRIITSPDHEVIGRIMGAAPEGGDE